MTWHSVHRKTSSNSSALKSQFASSTFGSKQPEVQKSPFAPRPFAPVQQKITPEDTADNEFEQNKFEATGLQIQAKYNTITPDGQERLDLLQAKMDSYWLQRKERTQDLRGFDLANISIHRPDATPSEPIQAKLTVGAPGDKYEQEADAIASQVMSMSDSAMQREIAPEETDKEVQTKPLAAGITPLVQREAMPEEEELQAKPLNASIQREVLPEEEEVQAKPLNTSIQREALPEEEVQTKPYLQLKSDAIQTGGNIETQLNSSKGGGNPLGDEVRGFMEPRFGHDFSNVRVHTGGDAVQMNRELGAQAFAHGSDIYFGAGKSPGNNELTAHELTHVVQQVGEVQRIQKDDQSEAERVKKLNEDYENAVTTKDWQKTAEMLNAFNKDDIVARLEKLKRGQIGAIYQGAIDNKLVGSESQVAHLTRATYLDLNYQNAVKGGNWKSAAEFLNGFNDTDITLKLEKLNPSQLSLLKRGALDGGYSRITEQIQQEPAPELLSSMSASDKLVKAIKRSANFMGGELGKRIDELLTPQSIAMMIGFTALFIAAQATPAGWLADGLAVIGLVASAALIGFEVSEVIDHIKAFIDIATNATTDADIDVAAKHFATAVTKVGVDVILAILLHKAGKAAKPYIKPPAGYVDMVTPEGKIIRVPQEAIPENSAASTGSGNKPPVESKISEPGELTTETPTKETPAAKVPVEWQPGDPLPKAQQAQIEPAKFERYSMDPNNTKNNGKWKAFEEVGYDVHNDTNRKSGAQDVINQLRQSLVDTPATSGKSTPHGPRFEVRGTLQGPNGKSGTLVSVWQIDAGTDTPRLITNWLEVHRK